MTLKEQFAVISPDEDFLLFEKLKSTYKPLKDKDKTVLTQRRNSTFLEQYYGRKVNCVGVDAAYGCVEIVISKER